MDFEKTSQMAGESATFTFKKLRVEKANGELSWSKFAGMVGADEVLRTFENVVSPFDLTSIPEVTEWENQDHTVFQRMIREVDADFLLREMDSDFMRRLDEETLKWSMACDTLIENEYWPNGSFDFAKAINLPGAEFRQPCHDHADEVESCCNKARAIFLKNRKWVIRSAIETMQRCALHDLMPIPVALETTQSILRRWRALARIQIRGAFIDATRAPITTHQNDDEIEDCSFTNNPYERLAQADIGSLIQEIFKTQPTSPSWKSFFAHAHDEHINVWLNVIANLSLSSQQADQIQQAIKLCLKEQTSVNAPSPALIEKLEELFAKD